MMKLCRDYSHTGFHSDCMCDIYYTVEASLVARCYNLYNDLQCAQSAGLVKMSDSTTEFYVTV
jgi:hypothetical protein